MSGSALLIGGAGDIGRACAAALSGGGFRVGIADLDRTAADRAAAATGAELALDIDVTSAVSVRDAVACVDETFGRLDVAVNLAAVGGPTARLHEYDDEAWERVIDVDLTGVFRCMREELVAMLPRGGSIINLSSIGAGGGFAFAPAYSASKHALTGLTKSAALAYAQDGIRINAVMPGFVETGFLRDRRSGEAIERLEEAHPMKRLARPVDVAAVVGFLATSDASFVTGACYEVDGGFLAGHPVMGV